MLLLEAGSIISGRYRLERVLARGGMGEVWVARHLQLQVDVAIKFMAPEFAASSEARARFEREARASALLKTPHVVHMYDYGVEHGAPFFVMELLDGEDLGARLARQKRLSLEATASLVGQVCKALRRAHEIGLVHRDIKPGNIFLAGHGDDEIVKILDFGIAKSTGLGRLDTATKTGVLLGSPNYMSPEQVRRHREVDHRSDLWSLGIIVYQCLTGELPFPSQEVGDVLVQICTSDIRPPGTLVPDLGPEVDRFIARALMRDPDERFQSARELAEAFAAVAAGSGAGLAGPHPIPAAQAPPSSSQPRSSGAGADQASTPESGPNVASPPFAPGDPIVTERASIPAELLFGLQAPQPTARLHEPPEQALAGRDRPLAATERLGEPATLALPDAAGVPGLPAGPASFQDGSLPPPSTELPPPSTEGTLAPAGSLTLQMTRGRQIGMALASLAGALTVALFLVAVSLLRSADDAPAAEEPAEPAPAPEASAPASPGEPARAAEPAQAAPVGVATSATETTSATGATSTTGATSATEPLGAPTRLEPQPDGPAPNAGPPATIPGAPSPAAAPSPRAPRAAPPPSRARAPAANTPRKGSPAPGTKKNYDPLDRLD